MYVNTWYENSLTSKVALIKKGVFASDGLIGPRKTLLHIFNCPAFFVGMQESETPQMTINNTAILNIGILVQ